MSSQQDRKPGFYWVELRHGWWEVAEFYNGAWHLTGIEGGESELALAAKTIGERLKSPDESAA